MLLSIGCYAAPANDTTHFAYGPAQGSGVSDAEVNFNFSGLLGTLGPNAIIAAGYTSAGRQQI